MWHYRRLRRAVDVYDAVCVMLAQPVIAAQAACAEGLATFLGSLQCSSLVPDVGLCFSCHAQAPRQAAPFESVAVGLGACSACTQGICWVCRAI